MRTVITDRQEAAVVLLGIGERGWARIHWNNPTETRNHLVVLNVGPYLENKKYPFNYSMLTENTGGEGVFITNILKASSQLN
jgi:hypothetical protein